MKIPIISRFFERKEEKRDQLSLTPKEFAKLFVDYFQTKSGVNINRETAIKISAVFACVNYKASTISSLPCALYKRSDTGKLKATNHDIYSLLHYLPNPETTAAEFWEMYIWNLELTGYGFAWIERDYDGAVKALWNIPTSKVKIFRNKSTSEKYYTVLDDTGKETKVYPENMLVTVGKRFQNANTAIDPIAVAREAMGLGLALEEYASKYFGNGASTSGIVELPVGMSPKGDMLQSFKDDFRKKYQSLQNAFNVMFLENGAKYNKISNNPEESQAIDARKFQVIEICRFFSVPPHKVMDIENGSNKSNMEQQNIDAVQTCLNPLCVKIEQSIYKDLLKENERKKYFAKFLTNALLRGDTNSRKDFYNAMLQNGVYSPNMVLEMEDENTYEGGDVRFVNGNVIPVSMLEDYLKWKMSIKKGGESNAGSNGDKNF